MFEVAVSRPGRDRGREGGIMGAASLGCRCVCQDMLQKWVESLASWEVTRASECGRFLPAIAALKKGKGGKKGYVRGMLPTVFPGQGRTSHIHMGRPRPSTAIPTWPLDQVEFLQFPVR